MKKLLLYIFILLSSIRVYSQSSDVRLIVSDGDKFLSEVNVLIDGDIKGFTDKNGVFNFDRKSGSKIRLSLSHVEFNSLDTLIELRSPVLEIILKPKIVTLESISVSTGYQSLPKYQTTGSFETITAERLQNQVGTNILPMLDGLTSGLTFDRRKGALLGLQIRGLSSLSSDPDMAQPLIVVDNFPFEGDIEALNPNDIANVTLLKDAAASAIWGARAGNGVIIITTKKGSFNRPLKINFNSNLTWVDKPDLFYVPLIESSDYIEYEKFLFGQEGYNFVLNNTTSRPMISPVVELLDGVQKGKIDEALAHAKIEEFKQYDLRNDYNKYLYRTGLNQQYFLSLDGGSEKFNFLFSTGLDKNISSARGDDFNRLTLRSMNSFRPTKNLNVHVDLNVSHSRSNLNSPGELSNIYPYARLADEFGKALPVDQNYRFNYIDTVGGGLLMDWKYYPLLEIDQRDNRRKKSNLRTNINLNYKLMKGVSVDVKYQHDREFGANWDHQSDELYFTRNLINRYSNISNGAVDYRIPKGGILDVENIGFKTHNIRGQINVDKIWSGVHNITGIIGGEVRKIQGETILNRSYGYNDRLKTSSSVDYVTRLPIFDRLGGTLAIPYVDKMGSSDNRFVSMFSNIAYSYQQRYTISLSARRDASNLFGVETNNKWKPLWSAGFKWTINKEKFFHLPWIDELIFRTSYGHSGNVNNGVPAVATISYSNSLSRLARLPNGTLQNPPNPLLRWEDVGQFNIGLDGNLINSKMFFTIEFYRKNAIDLITDETADPTLGMSSFMRNSGNLLTKGVDLTLRAKILDKSFAWDVNLLSSWNKNRLTKNNYDFMFLNAGEYHIPPSVGYPINSLFSYAFMGLNPETGNPLGVLNGEISEDYPALTNSSSISVDDLVYQGSVIPTFNSNLINSFSWKGFNVSINMSGKFGYKYRKRTILYASMLGTNFTQVHGDFYKRWQNPGDEAFTSIPSFQYPANSSRDNFYSSSEATVESASHVRIQDLSISYSLKTLFKNFQNLNFRFYCNNVNVIVWKKSSAKLDPLYGNSTPLSRTYSFGLNLYF